MPLRRRTSRTAALHDPRGAVRDSSPGARRPQPPESALLRVLGASLVLATPLRLKNLLVHNRVILPVADGQLDLGPWQAIFSCELDGGRNERLVITALGE